MLYSLFMFHRNIKILTWFNFFTDFKLYAPIAIIYFAQVSGSYALGMSVFSVVMISSALFEIPTGVLSDRIGRKRTMILGAAAAVLYSIFYAIGQSFWILFIGALFEGLTRSFYSGNNDALLHDTLAETNDQHQYDEFLGKVSAMFQLALAISAILGSVLASWSLPLIMWLSVIPQLMCFMLSIYLQDLKKRDAQSGNIFEHLKEAYSNFISNEKLRLLSLSSILATGLGEAGYQFQSAFYNTVWPVWAIGIAKAISNLLAAYSFHFSGRIIKKFGYLKILIAGNLYSRFTNIFFVLFPSVVSPLVMSTNSFFYGSGSVAKDTLMQREFSDKHRATMGSLNSFAGSIFFGIVAFILGSAADLVSPGKAFITLQFFQFSILWIYWKLFNHDRAVAQVL